MAHSTEPTIQNVQNENRPTTVENTPKRRPVAEPISALAKDKENGTSGNGEGNAKRQTAGNKTTKTQNKLTIGCWNIRRGLVRREKELEEILRKETVDVMFLVEADTSSINKEKDYTIAGYRTILPILGE